MSYEVIHEDGELALYAVVECVVGEFIISAYTVDNYEAVSSDWLIKGSL